MINEIIKQLKIDGKLIYLSQYGSHLYGLNTKNSDLDFRGVYIPTLDDVILKKDKDEINTELEIKITPGSEMDEDGDIIFNPGFIEKKKVDVKIFSLQKFIQLCSKADTNALDLLFSISRRTDIEQYMHLDNMPYDHSYSLFEQIFYNREKLINTGDLYHLIKYAHSQEKKYGEKFERYCKIKLAINCAKQVLHYSENDKTSIEGEYAVVKDMLYLIPLDDKYFKLTQHDNKGKIENYLWVCGTEQQYNLRLTELIERLENQIENNYADRTKKAFGEFGIDWKAMSHALRISYEGLELVKHGTITFPLLQRPYLLDIKSGEVEYKEVSKEISRALDELTNLVNQDELGWKYNEEFWNDFILQEVKNA